MITGTCNCTEVSGELFFLEKEVSGVLFVQQKASYKQEKSVITQLLSHIQLPIVKANTSSWMMKC
jgi:hypothetical protein